MVKSKSDRLQSDVYTQKKTQKLMGVKNFKRLLISIPKCIELNSELISVFGFWFGSTPGTQTQYILFLG